MHIDLGDIGGNWGHWVKESSSWLGGSWLPCWRLQRFLAKRAQGLIAEQAPPRIVHEILNVFSERSALPMVHIYRVKALGNAAVEAKRLLRGAYHVNVAQRPAVLDMQNGQHILRAGVRRQGVHHHVGVPLVPDESDGMGVVDSGRHAGEG